MAPDEVIPFRFWDQNGILSKLVMEFTYRFDDVLDPEKLRMSLNRLLEIGQWRSMGARLKKNAAGKLEYHIPAQYDDKRPGFTWSHETLNQRIKDHPLASQIPDATGIKRPTLFRHAEEFHDLITSEGHATKFSDWTDTDRPALEVHVVSFEDATLLTLSWSHVILDALGRQNLLKAWIAVLEGREEDVPEFVSLHVDPASSIAEAGDPKQHVMYRYALTGIWFALFVLGYMYELIIHSAESGRTICCPGPWVENLREQAMADAAASSHDEKSIFLSHGDVLLAWWTKVSVAAQQFGPSQPINVMNTTNLRGVFPDHLPDKDDIAYTTNATIATHTLTTSSELARMSVGDFALRLRQDLQNNEAPIKPATKLPGKSNPTSDTALRLS